MRSNDLSDDAMTYPKARILFLALAASPLVLGGVLWLALGGRGGGDSPGLVPWIVWGTVSGTGLLLWLLFRRMAVDPVTAWSRHRREEKGFTAAKLLTHLVVAWAGAESVGLAGVVVYFFLEGSLAMLVASLVASILCFGRSLPREAWFRTLEREASAAEPA